MAIHVLEGNLPIPVPRSEDDLGECIRFLRREGYDDNDERVAICMETFRKAQGGAAQGGARPPGRVPVQPVVRR